MDTISLKALLLEDSEADAQLLLQVMEQAGFEVCHERVSTKQGMLRALSDEADWDIIICEHVMPGLSSTDALQTLHARGLDIPLIIVSDHIAEESVMESVHAGAHDFLMKDNLSRLGLTIAKARQASQSRAEEQRLRELSLHLEELRESERVHLAREVHDELGGMLTAIKMDIRQLQKKCHGCQLEAEAQFQLLGEHLDSAINTVRRIITDLRPSVLDDLGLAAALEWQLSEFEKRYQLECQFDNQVPTLMLDQKSHEVAIFRIFQETLTNIAKHARASRVEVVLALNNNTLLLDINDNGIGISEENKLKKGHYGILGMNERIRSIGGSLEFGAGTTGGTRVSLRLPL